ncbi:MAG: hypothetical protein CL862_05995 [Cyanobium sp. NAT70]|nr:hypothetical protein [Cyanobium sp. NAT70]|tara:strand:+ start:7955 stop:8362 length:408 start_codon:yes stop_codon:yes gene_type:complete
MNNQDAFAAIALAAVASDGTLGREEAHALRRQLEHRSLYKTCSEAAMGDLFDRLLRLLRENGVPGLIEQALPTLSLLQQESALAVAAHLVHADRKVTEEEAQFLTDLAEKVDVPNDQAVMIVRSIEALNRDSLGE